MPDPLAEAALRDRLGQGGDDGTLRGLAQKARLGAPRDFVRPESSRPAVAMPEHAPDPRG
jgi:hypothetical protein